MIQTEGESEDEVIRNSVWAEWSGEGVSVGRGAGCSGLEPTTNRIRLRAGRPSPTASRHRRTSKPTKLVASSVVDADVPKALLSVSSRDRTIREHEKAIN